MHLFELTFRVFPLARGPDRFEPPSPPRLKEDLSRAARGRLRGIPFPVFKVKSAQHGYHKNVAPEEVSEIFSAYAPGLAVSMRCPGREVQGRAGARWRCLGEGQDGAADRPARPSTS